ncbi:MAG: PAS domain-containing protein [Actinomycetota bacterium]
MADRDELADFYEQVLDASPTMLVVGYADRNRTPVFVSRAFTRATGLSLDDGRSMHPDEWWDSIHADDRDAVKGSLEAFSAGGRSTGPLEYRFKTLSGWRWFSTAVSVFRPAEGDEPAQLMLASTDVTELRRAEEQELATRRFYERVLGAPSMLVAAIDGDTGERIWASRGMERLLGMTVDEFNALSIAERWEIIHPDDRAAEQARLAAVQAGEIPDIGTTHRLRTPDGWRWSRVEYTRLDPDVGPPLRIESVTDVHEQTLADRRRLSLLDGAPIPAAIRDLDENRLVYVNQAWIEATGHDVASFDAAFGADALALFHPDDRDLVRAAGVRPDAPYTARVRCHDGDYRWFQTDVTVLDGPGRPEALFFHTDVTDMIEATARADVMVERNPVAQVIFDLDSNIIEFANQALVDLSGRTVAEWNDLGEPAVRAARVGTPEEDLVGIFAAIDRAIETGEATGVRRRWRHADGSTRWLDCRYRSFPDPLRPEARRVLMTAADITEQVEIETQNTALFESAPVIVTISDMSSGLRDYVSPEFTAFTGLTLDDYNDLTRDERLALVHPDDRAHVNDNARRYYESNGLDGTESTYRFRSVDGYRWVTTQATILASHPDGSIAKLMISGVDIHDRVEADAYREAVLDASPAGITVYDFEHDRADFVNAAFTTLTGHTLTDLTTASPSAFGALVPDEDQDAMVRASIEAYRTGEPASVRHRIRHADGSLGWYRSTLVGFGGPGRSMRMLVSSIGITAQMAAEAQGQLVLETNPNAVIVYDPDTATTHYVNPTFTRITGFTAADLTDMDRDGTTSIHADDVDPERIAIDQALATGETVNLVVRLATATGATRWMDTWYTPFPDIAGERPRQILISGVDITERLAVEEQSRTILETSPSIIVVFDPDAVVTEYANPMFTEVTGYTVDDLRTIDRESIPSLVHPEDVAAENRAIERSFELDRAVPLTHRLRTVDGDYRWVETWYQPFPAPAGDRPRRVLITSNDVTERVTVQALNDSLVEASPIGFLVYDFERGRYDWTNPAFVDTTGYTADLLNERAATTYPVITVPEDVDEETAVIREAIETGRSTEIRHRYRCADGSIRTFESRCTALSQPDGTPSQRVLMSSIDITDRIEAEERERAILAMSPAMTVVVDVVAQRALYANDAYREINGLPSEWPRADDPPLAGDRIPPEERRLIGEAVAAAFEDGRPRIVTHRYQAATGRTRHLQSYFASFPDPTGVNPNRLAVTSIDITDRVEAQALSDTILDSSPAPTVVVDASDGSTVYANPAFTYATGHTAASLNAMPFAEMLRLTPDDERAIVDEAIATTLATGDVTSAERTYRSADGTVRWFDSRFLRLPTGSGNEVVITAIDTSERRAADEALEAERLRLERANRDLQDFVYIASHDLQEPLRTMTAFTELLALELPDDISDDATTSVRFIQQGAGRMRSLVQGLLEYSRIGPGREVADVDMAELVGGLVDDLADQIAREGARLDVDDLPTIRGDQTELRLIVQNLVSNAIKFRDPERPPTVSISATTTGDGWRFEVTDNGIGIEPRHVERIFAIFQRLHPNGRYEGTGMGLAHAKRAVANHGGEIGVVSEPDVGSTFWFTIAAGGEP